MEQCTCVACTRVIGQSAGLGWAMHSLGVNLRLPTVLFSSPFDFGTQVHKEKKGCLFACLGITETLPSSLLQTQRLKGELITLQLPERRL